MSKPEHLLLVGMMGAGKTTVGKMVAAQLGRPYLDSDAEVQRRTGRTVPELFAEQGEAAFRAEEKEVLEEALARQAPVVVSVAGGVVLDPDNRALLRRSGTVVWLRARPETLAARVGSGYGRPLLGDNPAEALVQLEAVRRPYYREVADATIDVDSLTARQVADCVLQVMGAAPEGTP